MYPTLLAVMLVSAPPAQAPLSPLPDASADARSERFLAAPVAGDDEGGAGPDAIVVTARPHAPPGDPFEKANAQSFAVTQAIDRAAFRPIAMGYKGAVPEPVRDGLRNVLGNLHEPVVFLNFLIQLKPAKASETLGRFAVNSTLGIAGLLDVAKHRPFRLPRRANGFGDSFGYYGIKPGPYFFLPLVGPTTLRDLIGGGLDRLVLPLAVGAPFNRPAYTLPTGAVSALNRRVAIDEALQTLRNQSDDPYAALRDAYLQKRQAEIDNLRGK